MIERLLNWLTKIFGFLYKFCNTVFPWLVFLIVMSLMIQGNFVEGAAWMVAYVLIDIAGAIRQIQKDGITITRHLEITSEMTEELQNEMKDAKQE